MHKLAGTCGTFLLLLFFSSAFSTPHLKDHGNYAGASLKDSEELRFECSLL